MSYEGRWLKIQAYKHNGELHRSWSHGFVIEDNINYIVLVSVRSSVIEADGRKWHTREPAIFVFFKQEWLNVISMLKKDGITYYINVASPSVVHDKKIKYIDYDLDIKLFPDGFTKLLDQKEYEKHAFSLDYSDDIKEVLSLSVKNIYRMIQNREFPFIDEEIRAIYQDFETNFTSVRR